MNRVRLPGIWRTTQVTNTEGRTFTVRLVTRGERYGLKRCLTHDADAPLVEFYDATYQYDSRFDGEGQFVARYYAATLLERSPGDRTGLCLGFGGIAVWSIDGETLAVALRWVRWTLARLYVEPSRGEDAEA